MWKPEWLVSRLNYRLWTRLCLLHWFLTNRIRTTPFYHSLSTLTLNYIVLANRLHQFVSPANNGKRCREWRRGDLSGRHGRRGPVLRLARIRVDAGAEGRPDGVVRGVAGPARLSPDDAPPLFASTTTIARPTGSAARAATEGSGIARRCIGRSARDLKILNPFQFRISILKIWNF